MPNPGKDRTLRSSMSQSIQHLRHEFKSHLEKWTKAYQQTGFPDETLSEIKKWGVFLERYIEEKISLLETDFSDHILNGEYRRSVREGFDGLERMMRSHQTFPDIVSGMDGKIMLEKMKEYYSSYLAPILNIMAKLENDFIAVTTNAILEKGRLLEKLEDDIEDLKIEKKTMKNNADLLLKIENLELKKEFTRLTLHHDRLNLYYFNHGRPKELSGFKKKADLLREKIRHTEEKSHAA